MVKGKGRITEEFLRRNHPKGTAESHIKKMKEYMDEGLSFENAHKKAEAEGFPAMSKKKINLGKSLFSKKQRGELVPIKGGKRPFYTKEEIRGKDEVKKMAEGGAVKDDEGDRVNVDEGDIMDSIPTSANRQNNMSKHLYKNKTVRAKDFPNSPAFNFELNGGYNIKSGRAFTGLQSKGMPRMGKCPYLTGDYAFDGKESGMKQYDKGLRSHIKKETIGATQRRTNDNYNISGRHKQDKAYQMVQTDRNIGYFKKNKTEKPIKKEQGLDYRDFNKWYIMDLANAMNGFRKKGVEKVLNKVMKERKRHSVDTLGSNLAQDRGGFYSSGFRAQVNLKKVVEDDNREAERQIIEDEEHDAYDEYEDVNGFLPAIRGNANIWRNNREQRAKVSQNGGVGDYDKFSKKVFNNDFLKTGKFSAEN